MIKKKTKRKKLHIPEILVTLKCSAKKKTCVMDTSITVMQKIKYPRACAHISFATDLVYPQIAGVCYLVRAEGCWGVWEWGTCNVSRAFLRDLQQGGRPRAHGHLFITASLRGLSLASLIKFAHIMYHQNGQAWKVWGQHEADSLMILSLVLGYLVVVGGGIVGGWPDWGDFRG